jgi:hypothetical protein
MGKSPVPVKKEEKKVEAMDFLQALKEAVKGKRIARVEWPKGEFGFMKKEVMFIHKQDNESTEFVDYIWAIQEGDISADDFIIFNVKK